MAVRSQRRGLGIRYHNRQTGEARGESQGSLTPGSRPRKEPSRGQTWTQKWLSVSCLLSVTQQLFLGHGDTTAQTRVLNIVEGQAWVIWNQQNLGQRYQGRLLGDYNRRRHFMQSR